MCSALLGLLALAAGPAVAASPAKCRFEVVRPESTQRRAEFSAWLKSHREELARDDGAWVFDDPAELGAYSLYVVDADNDGTLEHVLANMQGSGGYLGLWVFRKAGGGWRLDPQGPFGEQPVHEYRDPLGDGSRLFVRVCGKTYIQLAEGTHPELYPAPHAWQGGGVLPACDVHWLKEQRRVFQALFDRQLHREAFGLLGGVQECAASADPAAWLWIQSDRALVAHHLGLDDECLAFLAAARGSAAFASASPALRKAIDTNGRRCEQSRAGEGAGGYDFSWLREVADKEPTRQLATDRRFPALLRAVVPDGPDAKQVREDLNLAVFLPEPTQVIDGRYVVVSGCEPHNCGNKGLIWVDTASSLGIFATEEVLGSRQVPSSRIPASFWHALRETLPGLLPHDAAKIVYLEPDGSRSEITAPAE